MAEFSALPCEKIVFRGAIYPDWIKKNGKIQWQAFKLSVKDEDDGVSLSLVPGKFEGLNNPVEGVISVHVGQVRDVSNETYTLDVIQDKPIHAFIKGLLCPDKFEGEEKAKIYDDMKFICMEIAERAAREYKTS